MTIEGSRERKHEDQLIGDSMQLNNKGLFIRWKKLDRTGPVIRVNAWE